MSHTINCPQCMAEFEITDAMEGQIAGRLRSELEAELRAQRASVKNAEAKLKADRDALKDSQQSVATQIRSGIEIEREKLVAEAKKKAAEDLSVEIQDRDQQVRDLREKLSASQTAELELRKRERDLKAQKEQLELEVARKIDTERDKIRSDAKQQYEEEHQLKVAEKEKQIGDLRKQMDEMQRKIDQGSQQLQGEVQEQAIEELLATTFPADSIEPVAKGIRGGDTLQRVLDGTGLSCGRILWESKRTKNWSNSWLQKARDDQRAARAGCVVIVSETMPEGVRNFTLIDGVWVCSRSCVLGLAMALRAGMIELGQSKLAVQGQHEKMEVVYNYLASSEFKQRVSGVVEAFVTMRSDLESEKRSMQRIWSKREKQLERALANTAGMYGDLQGIIGASLPEIDGLVLPQPVIEAEPESAAALAVTDEDGTTPDL